MATGGSTTSGRMDIRQIRETWATFVRVVTWATGASVSRQMGLAEFLL